VDAVIGDVADVTAVGARGERAMRELTNDEQAEISRDAALPQLDARDLIDEDHLERAIKEMYAEVALRPDGDFHFLTGRPLAEALGYDPGLLDRIPDPAAASFAGVGTTSTSPGSRKPRASSTSAADRARTCSAPPSRSGRPAARSGST
jgi:hypothetical protein